jgi:hypothetical protein
MVTLFFIEGDTVTFGYFPILLGYNFVVWWMAACLPEAGEDWAAFAIIL